MLNPNQMILFPRHQQGKKCTQYGHSCLGGHGKRSASSSSSLLPENNFPLIQQLQQQKHLKPLSIPLYVYRNNQQESPPPPSPAATTSTTNDDDGRFQSGSLTRLAYLEHLLNMNNNNEFDQQQLPPPSILDRLRAQQRSWNGLAIRNLV